MAQSNLNPSADISPAAGGGAAADPKENALSPSNEQEPKQSSKKGRIGAFNEKQLKKGEEKGKKAQDEEQKDNFGLAMALVDGAKLSGANVGKGVVSVAKEAAAWLEKKLNSPHDTPTPNAVAAKASEAAVTQMPQSGGSGSPEPEPGPNAEPGSKPHS